MPLAENQALSLDCILVELEFAVDESLESESAPNIMGGGTSPLQGGLEEEDWFEAKLMHLGKAAAVVCYLLVGF